MGIFLPTPVGPFRTSAGAFFNTFTTRQDITVGVTTPTPIIQGGVLVPGSELEITAEGTYSTTGTPNLTLGLYIGTQAGTITTVIAESSVITTGTATLWSYIMRWRGLVLTTGTAGTVKGQGNMHFATSLTALSDIPIPVIAALRTFTWDTTIARAIGVCATWSASSASNTINVDNLSVMLLNGP